MNSNAEAWIEEVKRIKIESKSNLIIKPGGNRIYVSCPFCNMEVYERENGANAELFCGIAFGLHLHNCKNRPDYIEPDLDRLIREIFGDSN